MDYIILGTFIDCYDNDEFSQICNSNDPAANNFQGWFINGLRQHGVSIKNISFKTITKESKNRFKAIIEKICNNPDVIVRDKNIYTNHFQRLTHYYKRLSKCLKKDDIIIVYSLSLPALISAIIKSRKHKNKICIIIPDLPLYMSSRKSLIYRILKRIDNFLIKTSIKFCSHFVILSKYMNSYLPKHKDSIIIEGAYNNIARPTNSPYKQNEPYILYTGTIDQRYGICNLIDAFLLTNIEYNLIICGNGGKCEKEYIIKMGKIDKRIKYLGSLNYQDVLYLQQNASLLVNPRNNKGEYTKYSFPSKTMEYLAAGVPVLLYELDGIPDEYYKYCYHINGTNTSINTLARKITEILSKPTKDNQILGEMAKNFIINNKNGYVQTHKIIEYINKTE